MFSNALCIIAYIHNSFQLKSLFVLHIQYTIGIISCCTLIEDQTSDKINIGKEHQEAP